MAKKETPQTSEPEETVGSPKMLASMGIYVFSKEALFEILETSSEIDFGKGIFPQAIQNYKVCAHLFDGYWEDIGTIKAFYESMIALTDPQPSFDFYNEHWPIFTHARFLPGARVHDCKITESVICDAARMRNAQIHKSVIGIRSMIREGSRLDHVVMMGADIAENHEEEKKSNGGGKPPLGIGDGCKIENAIIDKNVRIGRNVRALAKDRPMEATGEFYAIRDGILIIPKSAVIPDNTVIS